ncbi:hypothetical protein TNIN_441531 [Trichonephila inaurata madagascariensis]|uniref:Uncharacterized protein n=1 Tax=Trichonephila inaurata madagascariensis TaxID=2747483 RepID=A0A8X6Y0D7_9ARAC|nr:hypothetical protein TNIN_441531 [Trichonephila inaurata madagascariensis]
MNKTKKLVEQDSKAVAVVTNPKEGLVADVSTVARKERDGKDIRREKADLGTSSKGYPSPGDESGSAGKGSRRLHAPTPDSPG